MIDPGDTGVERDVLERFLEILPGLDPLEIFPVRFTLELRTRDANSCLHVNRSRDVIRPVVPEDSRKTAISLPLSHFVRLVEYGGLDHWAEALEEGHLTVS